MLTRRPTERQMAMAPLRSVVDWLFEDPWLEPGRWTTGMMPSIDMRETNDAFIVEAEMPGVKPEDIDVTLDGRTLVIRGEYGNERAGEREGETGKGGRYLVRERRSGTYMRAITLPSAVDADRVETSFENGELMIRLPKAAEARTRRIPISGGSQGPKPVGPGSEAGTPR